MPEDDIDKLKKMAAPNSERIALAVEANTVLLRSICKYKEEQKQGDIRSRKRSECYSKFGILIALAAVYISITGLDGRVAVFITGLFRGYYEFF
jgi:hypothetical protein